MRKERGKEVGMEVGGGREGRRKKTKKKEGGVVEVGGGREEKRNITTKAYTQQLFARTTNFSVRRGHSPSSCGALPSCLIPPGGWEAASCVHPPPSCEEEEDREVQQLTS